MANESRSHAPGHDSDDGAMRQHKTMASGGSIPGGSNFGIGPVPGTNSIKHPEGPPDAKMLGDHERAGPPNFKIGDNSMHATHHSAHGPHLHPHDIHQVAPKGPRPHHVK